MGAPAFLQAVGGGIYSMQFFSILVLLAILATFLLVYLCDVLVTCFGRVNFISTWATQLTTRSEEEKLTFILV